MTVSWTPPESDNGAKITSYVIEKKEDSPSSVWEKVTTHDVTGDSLKVTASGLKTGSTYKFRVSAENKVGLGKPSKESEKYTACGTFYDDKRSVVTASMALYGLMC